jgi:hypothetical protein
MISKADLKRIPDEAWILVEDDGEYRRYACRVADGVTAYKTELIGDDTVLALNKQEYDDSAGRRFRDIEQVARIPLNVFYDPAMQIVEKLQQGDKDHMKWWLNRDVNRMWRNFRGTL